MLEYLNKSPSIDSGFRKSPSALTVHFPTLLCFNLFCSDFMDIHYFTLLVLEINVRIMCHIMHFSLQLTFIVNLFS